MRNGESHALTSLSLLRGITVIFAGLKQSGLANPLYWLVSNPNIFREALMSLSIQHKLHSLCLQRITLWMLDILAVGSKTPHFLLWIRFLYNSMGLLHEEHVLLTNLTQYKTGNAVESYRAYYMSDEKRRFAFWKKKRATYRFITDKTNRSHHGLIAQSAEKVLPTAVSGKGKQFIPSVYRSCQVTGKHTIHIPTDTPITGTRLRVTDCSGGDHDITVEFADQQATCEEDLTQWMDGDQIFVHGHEIDDFRSIDYNQVMVVNVAATKCLARELEETKASLAETRAELAELKAMVRAMMGDM